MINPEDYVPDLDDLRRGQLWETELGDMPGHAANVLDDWLHEQHGVTSSRHGVGSFLEALADVGYRVVGVD